MSIEEPEIPVPTARFFLNQIIDINTESTTRVNGYPLFASKMPGENKITLIIESAIVAYDVTFEVPDAYTTATPLGIVLDENNVPTIVCYQEVAA